MHFVVAQVSSTALHTGPVVIVGFGAGRGSASLAFCTACHCVTSLADEIVAVVSGVKLLRHAISDVSGTGILEGVALLSPPGAVTVIPVLLITQKALQAHNSR